MNPNGIGGSKTKQGGLEVSYCTNCKGTGKQVFHGSFESSVGICGFCKGTGKRKDQLKWFDNISTIKNMGGIKMKPSKLKTYCFYCQDEEVAHVREVAVRRNNGFKLMDFEAHLCKNCNFLDDKTLSDYFSV